VQYDAITSFVKTTKTRL